VLAVIYLIFNEGYSGRVDLDGYLYFHSTRGELLRRLGRGAEARAAYGRALELATSTPERRFLTRRLDQL
jgi:RNA polymerase sigma-70 factor (ECF subfamily)